MRSLFSVAVAAWCACVAAAADGPSDNLADKVRRVPPPGIKIADADREELDRGVEQLGKAIVGLPGALKPLGKRGAGLLELMPDVQIYHNAVRYALHHDEIYSTKEVAAAKTLLQQGLERASQL